MRHAPPRGRLRRQASRTAPAPPARGATEQLMRSALLEARKGLGRTSPNPAVGAVIVKNGRIIARGHHAVAGGPHAEVVALRAAGPRARGADLYTTLEPCNHWGKTPPCTLGILQAGVARVVVGSRDPNPVVNGQGVARLRRGGVTVVQDVLRAECDALNAHWLRYITTGRPFVTLKVAATLDGKLATRSGDSRWVTGPEARAYAHRLRDRVDAVLVGRGTARADDPLLTARPPGGRGRDPIRVVLDSRLTLPRTLRLFRVRSRASTLVAHVSRRSRRLGPGVETIRCKQRGGHVDIADLLAKLAQRGIVHLLVEGGAEVHGSFLASGLVDQVMVFLAPKIAGGDALSWAACKGSARMAEALALDGVAVERLGDDVLVSGVPRFAPPRRRISR